MLVDSYRWLPPSLKTYFATRPYEAYEGVPWTPLALPLRAATVALVTTAGINVRGVEPPFDYAREKAEPHWGDPSFRIAHLSCGRVSSHRRRCLGEVPAPDRALEACERCSGCGKTGNATEHPGERAFGSLQWQGLLDSDGGCI